MQFGAEAIHRAVMLAALPWSWFVPQASSYPSLGGDRREPDHPQRRYLSSDYRKFNRLVALSGILPAFLRTFSEGGPFFCGKANGTDRSLKKLKFDTPACLALDQAHADTSGLYPGRTRVEQNKHRQSPRSRNTQSLPSSDVILSDQVVLIPDDIYRPLPG